MKGFCHNVRNAILNDPFYIILPVIAVSVRLTIFIIIPYIYEDAYITFRYAENLASGNGFVFNSGEKVLGTTTPLFAMILALLKLTGISCATGALIIRNRSGSLKKILTGDCIHLREKATNNDVGTVSRQ